MIEDFCQWLSATAASQALARLEWFVPLVQSIHLLAIAALVTAFVALDGRLLRGTVGDGPALARRFAPQLRVAFAVLLATGLLLTLVEPARELLNTAFRLKLLGLVALAWSGHALLARLRQPPHTSGAGATRCTALAATNLALLLTVIVLGRLIAYL